MKAKISRELIKSLGCRDLAVFDTQQPGLMLRLRESGVHSYRVGLGRGRFVTLGSADQLTPTTARGLASAKRDEQRKFELGLGPDPMLAIRRKKAATFKTFLDEQYEPWAVANLKHAGALLARIHAQFDDKFGEKPITEITPWAVESWRSGRLKTVTKATANRDLAALKACLSKAVQWNVIPDHPLRRVKLSKEDRSATVRFLSADEEKRLRAALTARDDTRRAARAGANDWRRQRGYPELPDLGVYGDHLTPIVLLALNTGLRRGEMLGLEWADVDLSHAILTVRGEGAKSGRTRYLPLNAEAVAVLKAWQAHATGDLVFPGENGERMFSLKTSWLKVARDAGLKNFRFHDLRHSFASKLVQAGVDLNTVRELLGHSDFALTLRYAHLAAENKAAAVAKLGSAR